MVWAGDNTSKKASIESGSASRSVASSKTSTTTTLEAESMPNNVSGCKSSKPEENPDFFHVKIWDANTGDVMYDNGVDQALSSGSIDIHPVDTAKSCRLCGSH